MTKLTRIGGTGCKYDLRNALTSRMPVRASRIQWTFSSANRPLCGTCFPGPRARKETVPLLARSSAIMMPWTAFITDQEVPTMHSMPVTRRNVMGQTLAAGAAGLVEPASAATRREGQPGRPGRRIAGSR